MKVAVASGKGGTGKTILATSLALAWPGSALLDCDVEAPDAHLILRPAVDRDEVFTVPVPRVEEESCTHCGLCAELCRFHTLAVLPRRWMIFDELCHFCGGCAVVCPTGAIREVPHPLGRIVTGRRGGTAFVQGILNEGEVQTVPLIEAVIERAPGDGDVVIDCPPGASCPMLAAAGAADVVLLVTEPTPFGLHDLEAAVAAVRELGRPMGVVINRSDWGDGRVRRFCERASLPVLLEIPHRREIAEGYARAVPLVESAPDLVPALAGLRRDLRQLAEGRTAA